jgi:hypothetical protein
MSSVDSNNVILIGITVGNIYSLPIKKPALKQIKMKGN